MKWTYRILRTIIVSLLFLAVGIPIFLYLVLWLAPVHNRIRDVVRTELSGILGSEVNIGRLEVVPFTRLKLNDISIVEAGDTILSAQALNAGVSGRNLLRGRIVVTAVELMEPDIRLRRDSAGAPLNVQPIFDRLKGDGSKPPTRFNLAVHTVVIRHGSARYDVDSAARRHEGFDVNHIALTGLNADLTAPKISNGDIRVSLKRLAVRERSGLHMRRLAATINLHDSLLTVNGLTLYLDNTKLAFADMDVKLRGYEVATVELLPGSAIYPADLAAFHPGLAAVAGPLKINARVDVMTDSMVVRKFNVYGPGRELFANIRGEASMRAAAARTLDVGVNGTELARTLGLFTPLKGSAATLLGNLGNISFTGTAAWRRPQDATLQGVLESDMGKIDVDARMVNRRLRGVIEADGLDLAGLFPGKELGSASLGATFDLSSAQGRAAVSVDHIRWRGHDFRNVDLNADYDGKAYAATVEVEDSLLCGELTLTADLTPGDFSATIDGDLAAMSPEGIGLTSKYPGYVLSGQVKGAFQGDGPLLPTGQLIVSNLRFLDAEGRGLREAPIVLTSDFSSADVQNIRLKSDLIDADVTGRINLRTVGPMVNNLLASSLPQYFSPQPVDSVCVNNFALRATVKDDAPLLSFLSLPVQLLYPATLGFELSRESAAVNLSAPYIRKGNSLISSTALRGSLGKESRLTVGTTMSSKFGDIAVRLAGTLADGLGNIDFGFDNNIEPRYGGDVKLRIRPLYEGLDANIIASTLTLGGIDWAVAPAYIGLRNGTAIVHGFGLNRPGQELSVSGVVSEYPEDRLVVKLDNINVDYIFQTLQLSETLRFGGDATGTVTASALFSHEPILRTENLYVKGLKYGGCVMGNANIRSRWNNETRGIELHADVDDPAHEGSTTVDGKIYIVDKKLDFRFMANHSPAGFLHTFIKTWASDVGGTASGNLHLFGDFANVNLEGEAAAENFFLTVGYTGVTYFASDTVRIRPGVIDLDNVTVRDRTGRTGLLNGQLTHDYFKNAKFSFLISDLDNMLVLDTSPTPDNDRWYGSIRADGSAEISGVPGLVKITANAVSAPGSEFTFAMTDARSATEYKFLTFRDVTPVNLSDSTLLKPGSPELDRQMRAQVARTAEQEAASNFVIELHVDVDPSARINLIMDPKSGDKITCSGVGGVDVKYGSDTDNMTMHGEYVIEKGEYNFSLQDIILKAFTLRAGSEIKFHGDPMDADLNISAINQVNANLSDLDESFLNDKEVQRTKVPVYAVLNVTGSVQAPDIKFDIDLPTLSSDVVRKVKSIVSTEDMMNRQIIYLLAFNRFYTPDYMVATKGNDLMSVASGTLSSQLSNIFGQISDKISVAPSVRTESGDFSDVEFDVALSGTLLNNRLLLNGNFGYRDKALNNNQFIGDFDVEYLLTRRGNWRLKAYNHFNDRNLYVKQALTTQGLGIVFKHDFDRLFQSKKK